jgi:hypothetical protein
MTSPFLPQPDESFHGFIYRISLLKGLPVRKLFNKAGHWNKINSISNISSHFHLYGDQILLDLLDRSGYVKNENRPFRDPTTFSFALYDFIHGVRKETYGPSYNQYYSNAVRVINFCNCCIRDSIESIGFGYFKAQWQFLSVCETHKTPLYKLMGDSTNLVEIACQNILKGNIPKKSCILQKSAMDMLRNLDVSFDKTNEIFISPCMKHSFKLWLASKQHYFPDDVLNSLPSLSANTINQGALRQLDYHHEILFLALINSSYQPFHNFWRNTAKKTVVNFGIITKIALQKEIYISTELDCQRCNKSGWRTCPANLVIEIQENEKPLFWECLNSILSKKK